MANAGILPGNASQAITGSGAPFATQLETLLKPAKPILPPSGTLASGGPTVGQLFPVGNR